MAKRGERVRIDHETAAERKRLRALERENAILKEELTLLKKPSGSVPSERRSFRVHRAEPGRARGAGDVPALWRLAQRLLRLAQSPTERTRPGDAQLLEEIREVFAQHDGIYGSPRVHVELREQGHRVGEKRVAWLMHADRLKARSALIYRANPGSHGFYKNLTNQRLEKAVTGPEPSLGGRHHLPQGRR